MRLRWLVIVILLGGCLVAHAADAPAKSHQDYRADGLAAYRKKDYVAARDAFAAALELRPDSPRYLYNLAAMAALTGDEGGASKRLRDLAELGVYLPAQKDGDFGALQGKADFNTALRALDANREPRGNADLIAELTGRTGIIEGIAHRDRTGDLFLGDAHHRCIWKRDLRGQVTRFTEEDEDLLGVFGLAIDERRNTLWAAMTALPEMAGFDKKQKGEAALAEFNLFSGELRRVVPVPIDGRDHHLGDLVVGGDGTVFLADSAAPVIWSYTPGQEEMEKFLESRDFASLQGIVFLDRTLIVADYANGLFAIDPTDRRIRAFAPPAKTTLLGIDGIVAIPGGLVATQNGIEPQRVIRLAFSPNAAAIREVRVLAAGLSQLTDLTLLTLVNDRPTVVANAGWDGFDPAKTPHPPAHTVRLFQVPLQ